MKKMEFMENAMYADAGENAADEVYVMNVVNNVDAVDAADAVDAVNALDAVDAVDAVDALDVVVAVDAVVAVDVADMLYLMGAVRPMNMYMLMLEETEEDSRGGVVCTTDETAISARLPLSTSGRT